MKEERDRFGPGIYLHFPFCHSRCGYCDFFVVLGDRTAQRDFCRSLLREIEISARPASKRGAEVDATGRSHDNQSRSGDDGHAWRPIQTVFFGGGTPSLLEPEDVDEILQSLRTHYPFAADPEISIECNPESLDLKKMRGYREAGVTRFSMGVQSMDPSQLALLDRRHGVDEVRDRVRELLSIGQTDFSLDLIYGLPNLDVQGWEDTLTAALQLDPTHLSAYLLGLEPHVPLARKLKRDSALALPEEDTAVLQFERLREQVGSSGLAQYEISNFSKPGHESRHNQIYWTCGDYLGFGPSAHSHQRGARWSNVRSLRGYISSIEAEELPRENWEHLDRIGRFSERVFLGLRRNEGVTRDIFFEELEDSEQEQFLTTSTRLAREGWLLWEGDRLRLTDRAQFVSNAVFTELLAEF